MKPETARIQAIAWANRIVKQSFVVLDLETTDKYPDKAEPVQVAIVSSAGETLLKSYIKPAGQMSMEAQQVTGITPDMLKDAPDWREVQPLIKEHLYGQTVVIYNAPFDTQVMTRAIDRNGMPPIPSGAVECAMSAYRQFAQAKTWSLESATRAFDLISDGAHDAEADCLMTLEVVKAMAAVDMSKPQVFEFEKDTFTILMPGKSPHTLIDRTEGARARIGAKISQPDTTPVQTAETPETPASEESATPETELTTLQADMERYARDFAQVRALEEQLNLKEREKAIKERALKLIQSGVTAPHHAITQAKQPQWLKFDEAELLPLARKYMPHLIEERINTALLKEAYETLQGWGMLDWAIGVIQVNDAPVVKFDSKVLFTLAAQQQDNDDAH